MKKYLLIFLTVVGLKAATPPYEAFNTNQFDAAPHHVNLQPGMVLWTNIDGTYFTTATNYSSLEATNILSDQTLAVYGSLRILSSLFTNLVAGENDLNVFNVGSVALRSTDPSAQVRLNTGNGTASLLLLSYVDSETNGFHLLNGDTLTDADFFHVYLSGGDWNPTHTGETMLLYANGNGWAEVGRFGGPTNVVFNPGMVKIEGGDTTLDFLGGKLLAGAGLTITTNNPGGNESLTISITPSTNCMFYTLVGGTNISVTSSTVDTNTTITIDSSGDNFWAFTGGYLQPRVLTQPLFWTNSVTWGPGTTNVLYRSGSDLLYTNSALTAPYPGFMVVNGGGNRAKLSAGGNLAIVSGEVGVSLIDNISAGNDVRWSNHYFQPTADTHAQLGGDLLTSGVPWYQVNAYTNTIYGFRDGSVSTNYSRLAISHTGTNGVVMFSSQASGSAGAARPFEVDRNLGAAITVGDTTFVDLFYGTQTNSVSGALTIGYATNGLDNVELTHVRWLLNSSGSDQTLSIPSEWRTNFLSAVPAKLTNGTMTRMFVTSLGSTATAALQTNVYVEFSYYK